MSSLSAERSNSLTSDPVPLPEVALHCVSAATRTIVVLLGSRPAEHPTINRLPVVLQLPIRGGTVIGALLQDRPLNRLSMKDLPPAFQSAALAGIDSVLQKEICLQVKTVAGTLEAGSGV